MKYNIAPLVLLGFAVFYLISAFVDYRHHKGSFSIAGKTRLRVGLIFTVVAFALLIFADRFR